MESRKDNGEDSEETDWGTIFTILKSRGFLHNEILQLSYLQLEEYMQNIFNEKTYPVFIPYLGSGKDKDTKKVIATPENKITSRDELMGIINQMNNDFK